MPHDHSSKSHRGLHDTMAVDNGGKAQDDIEMSKMPLEEDIMQLARLGEIGAIQKLFQGGKYDATFKDDQGVTPLHVGTEAECTR